MIGQKSYSLRAGDIEREWLLVNAGDRPLGRLASAIAQRLRGKHKASYSPHLDNGDYIVVINAAAVAISGKKRQDKIYHHHSGFIGGLKSISFEDLLKKSPERIIRLAVRGMLPRGPLGRQMLRKLKIYADAEHPHQAQQPQPFLVDPS